MSTSDKSAASPTAYDLVPYPSASFPQSHPLRLAAMGRLMGLKAPAPSTARVLELGCADGANLLPMADQFPLASFVGVDASKVQIAAGQKAIAGAGLKNVELRCENILDFPASAGKFDYIIVHGIFSWVPEPVREKIMQICSAHLAENGIAYISYNALPGWNMRRSLRDMMLFHTKQFAEPAMKIQQARALLAFMSESVPTENDAFGMLLKSESELLGKQMDSYLAHDLLEEENTPFYLHEFVARAERHQLQYVGEPSLSQMLSANFPDKVRDTLNRVGKTVVAQEQYMDFLRNRFFRQTLLCHQSQTVNRQVQAAQMGAFAFQSYLKRPEKPVDLTQGVQVGFVSNAGSKVNVSDSFLKAAFQAIAQAAPGLIGYEDVLATARKQSRPFLGTLPPDRDQIDEATLQSNLLNLYSKGFLEIAAEPVPVVTTSPVKPWVSSLARFGAANNARTLTNRLHVSLPADVFARFVIAACDGTRTQEQLVTEMIKQVKADKLGVKENDQPVTDEKRLRELLKPQVEAVVQRLAEHGFFAP
jgi:methyltransferase-like protein/SAM-dependent methyltransferase